MMSKITGVLVDNHIYDIKNDMTNGYHFPNCLLALLNKSDFG